MARYKTGWDPRERGKQLTICFEEGYTSTQMYAAVQALKAAKWNPGKNYTFVIHPEMLAEAKNMLDMGSGVWDNGVYENTQKTVPSQDASGDLGDPDDSAGSDFL